MSRSAIIDIGYNAIRAVVYESDTLGAPEIFNDKLKNDILGLLGLEDIDAKHQTYLYFQYLVHIFKQLSVTSIKCVATAVLRGHPKAEDFKQIIKQKYQIEIEIISGEKEAYLAAAGLILGVSDADGIAADLGGGSLELASISNKKVGQIKSLSLGTKVINKHHLNNLSTITEIIKQEFGDTKYKNLYLIGGALRFIGRFYIEFIDYPLKTLHNLEISKEDFEIYLEKLERICKTQCLNKKKKIDFNGVMVAQAMLEVFSPEKVVISNYGLKEGVRLVSLPFEEQTKDIIDERIKALIKFNENVCKFDKYREAISPLLINPDLITIKTIDFSIMLTQFNRNIDKTLNANFAVEFILASDIPFSHRQRVMLASTLAFVYYSKTDLYINRLSKKILTKQDYYNAQIIGNFIRIAREIDGPEFSVPSFALELKGKYIEINTNEMLPRQVFDKVCDHLKDIGLARKSASIPGK